MCKNNFLSNLFAHRLDQTKSDDVKLNNRCVRRGQKHQAYEKEAPLYRTITTNDKYQQEHNKQNHIKDDELITLLEFNI